MPLEHPASGEGTTEGAEYSRALAFPQHPAGPGSGSELLMAESRPGIGGWEWGCGRTPPFAEGLNLRSVIQ